MRALVLLLIAAFAAPSLAQSIVLPSLPDGVYVVTVKGQSVSVERGRTPGGVVPVPTPDPTPDPTPQPSPIHAEVRAAVAQATADSQRAVTAANLADLMELMQSQISSGTLKDYAGISAATGWMFDQVTSGRAAAWKPLKDLLGKHLAAMGQEGATPEEYSGFFAEVAEGLEASFADMPTDQVLLAENSKLRINMDMLLKLFLFFIQYILPLIT